LALRNRIQAIQYQLLGVPTYDYYRQNWVRYLHCFLLRW
jgi:hypothetical protein